jgi:hypothetical protein
MGVPARLSVRFYALLENQKRDWLLALSVADLLRVS